MVNNTGYSIDFIYNFLAPVYVTYNRKNNRIKKTVKSSIRE